MIYEAEHNACDQGVWIKYVTLDESGQKGASHQCTVLDVGRRVDANSVFSDSCHICVHGLANRGEFPVDPDLTLLCGQPQRPYPLLHFWTFITPARLDDVDLVKAYAPVVYEGKVIGLACLDRFEET